MAKMAVDPQVTPRAGNRRPACQFCFFLPCFHLNFAASPRPSQQCLVLLTAPDWKIETLATMDDPVPHTSVRCSINFHIKRLSKYACSNSTSRGIQVGAKHQIACSELLPSQLNTRGKSSSSSSNSNQQFFAGRGQLNNQKWIAGVMQPQYQAQQSARRTTFSCPSQSLSHGRDLISIPCPFSCHTGKQQKLHSVPLALNGIP
ncbi:hypothetical protein B0T22DRAFT_132386 [Podospora appendiculata]|uniref:Uncharacterized protein n=1 Tax=Podospora appendiculata TaxID=314037 RepID=A0AAE1CBL1_9PEZI|nr:hypothetical protein B0T22DRAFT_132386 [Podospora appendiculata]